ncbi:hypothetical protein CVT25_009195 [Psilocybe cyanescens]|uniref:Uncharacterized protein n=1 Tax=Psilocybe cyanescens TaxID=93625 RepID=A0A409WWE2_PSICY|nr:hypothetical protein CVT25_009195 [Psilocybe cyanescens]
MQFCFKGGTGTIGHSSGEFDSNYAQWAKVLRRMVAIWRLARLGCAVLLPLSITLLQIDGVVNTVLSRTCTISTAVFAAAGLISSGVYLFLRNELINNKNKTRWIQASQVETSYSIQSIEFWTYLALPVASMIWGILTCVITVVCIAWTHHSDDMEEPESAFISSAVFITSLILITLVYVYKAAGMAIWP